MAISFDGMDILAKHCTRNPHQREKIVYSELGSGSEILQLFSHLYRSLGFVLSHHLECSCKSVLGDRFVFGFGHANQTNLRNLGLDWSKHHTRIKCGGS